MTSKIFANLHHQTRFVVLVARRDLAKRIASGAMMLALLMWAGDVKIGLLLAVGIALCEVSMLTIQANLPTRNRRMSNLVVFWAWATNCISSMLYLTPALVLASSGSDALLLAGFMWLFGVFVHISNTFAAFPFYNFSMMLPGFALAFGVLWIASQRSSHDVDTMGWAIAMGLMVVYIFNTFETLAKQKNTASALNAAREESNARLKALEYLSDHDSLTGLLTRRAFDDRLRAALSARRDSAELAVFLIDLDGFKPINDTYSHSAGDQVLRTIGERLSNLSGTNAIVARFGGDEFAIALPKLSSLRVAYQFARSLRDAIEKPIEFEEKALQVGVSIGISVSGPGNQAVSSLCATADQAMYLAKSSIDRKICLYNAGNFPPRPTFDDRRDLLAAFAACDIRPYYQPKVDLESGLTIGFEALARWVHPERGLLPPSEFLHKINYLGLQADFLVHMTQCVLRDLEGFLAEGVDPGQVSVNVPEVTLATLSGRAELDRLLKAHPVAMRHLTLEITEDVFIARSSKIIRDSIIHFRRLGLRVSLDDFGTGFASFQHLRELEFDELKIDPSFIADLCSNKTTEVLVQSFLRMAQGLGVNVIAEGVETSEQRAKLRSLGYRQAQGFHFGHAMAVEESRIRLLAEQTWVNTTAAQ